MTWMVSRSPLIPVVRPRYFTFSDGLVANLQFSRLGPVAHDSDTQDKVSLKPMSFPRTLSEGDCMAAAARACVDVLRGARVLIKQNKEVIRMLLRSQPPVSKRDMVEILEGLAAELADILSERDAVSATEGPATEGHVGPRDQSSAAHTEQTVKRRWEEQREEPIAALVGSTDAGRYAHSAPRVSGMPVEGRGGDGFKPSARAQVLESPDLLLHVMRMLDVKGDGLRRFIGELGRQSLVCRLWMNVARSQELWKWAAQRAMPVLRLDGESILKGMLAAAGGCYHRFMVQLGRMMKKRVIIPPSQGWAHHLGLVIDVWDGEGEGYILSSECNLEVEEVMYGPVTVRPHDRVMGHAPAFTTASRNAESCESYLRDEEGERLWMRVLLVDRLSGHSAVLFDTDFNFEPNIAAISDGGSVVNVISSPLVVASVAYGPAVLEVRVRFRMRLEESTDATGGDLSDAQKVWRADLNSFEMLWSSTGGSLLKQMDVARFMYAALGL